MTNLKLKLTTGLVTAAFFVGVVAPTGAFASTVKIRGNGAGSNNTVKLTNSNTSSVKQINKTAVVNVVVVLQNTGGNKANNNTGGDVNVNSGNATSTVRNTTTTGSNVAAVDPCGCVPADDTLKIKGNGAGSNNSITVKNTTSSSALQVNKTLVVNGVLVGQNTGLNQANNNVGGDGSDPSVDSGNATSTVTNDVTTGSNVLTPTP